MLPGNWSQLESAAALQPSTIMAATSAPSKPLPAPYSSGKSAKDWNALEKEAEAEGTNDDDPLNTLLKKITKMLMNDTKRAMMKSYQNSAGTVLTTNWKDAREKDFAKEIQTPKGQVFKNWEGDVIANEEEE